MFMKAVSYLPWGLSHLDHSFMGNSVGCCNAFSMKTYQLWFTCSAVHFPLLDYHLTTWRRLVLRINTVSVRSANLEERFIRKCINSSLVLIVLRYMPVFWCFLILSLGRMKPALICNTSTCCWGSYSTNAEEGYLGKMKEMKTCFDSFALCVPQGPRVLLSWLSGVDIPLLWEPRCLLTSLCFFLSC